MRVWVMAGWNEKCRLIENCDRRHCQRSQRSSCVKLGKRSATTPCSEKYAHAGRPSPNLEYDTVFFAALKLTTKLLHYVVTWHMNLAVKHRQRRRKNEFRFGGEIQFQQMKYDHVCVCVLKWNEKKNRILHGAAGQGQVCDGCYY